MERERHRHRRTRDIKKTIAATLIVGSVATFSGACLYRHDIASTHVAAELAQEHISQPNPVVVAQAEKEVTIFQQHIDEDMKNGNYAKAANELNSANNQAMFANAKRLIKEDAIFEKENRALVLKDSVNDNNLLNIIFAASIVGFFLGVALPYARASSSPRKAAIAKIISIC